MNKSCEDLTVEELPIALVAQLLLAAGAWWLIVNASRLSSQPGVLDAQSSRYLIEMFIAALWPFVAYPTCIPACAFLEKHASRRATLLDVVAWGGCVIVVSPHIYATIDWSINAYQYGGWALILDGQKQIVFMTLMIPLTLAVTALGIISRAGQATKAHAIPAAPQHLRATDIVCISSVCSLLVGVFLAINRWATWLDDPTLSPKSVMGLWLVSAGLVGLIAQLLTTVRARPRLE